jgi:iron complex transport system permease protein
MKTNFEKKYLKWNFIFIGLLMTLFFTLIITITIGSVGPIGSGNPERIPMQAVWDILIGKSRLWPDSYKTIIMDIRLPRILLAALAGCALAVSGVVMQGIFRNPMADPFIIGLSSGAAVGASISILLGLSISIGIYSTPFLAFVGAGLTIFGVYFIARSRGKVRAETLLLTGIAIGSFLTAVTSFLMYVANEQFRFLFFWLLGGLYKASWNTVAIAFSLILLGVVIIQFFARDLNAMVLGEEPAMHLGIDTKSMKKILLIFSSLVTGTAVAFTGIIGFVGLITPHIMRILVGPNHRILLPASALTGAILLIWSDTIARTILSPTEIPVGIITAFCGAPFFVYLLQKSKKGKR